MKFWTAISLVILSTVIFLLCTMNHGHPWGDDFAMYMMHAKQIANGQPYAETGFIYNDLAPTYAPASYPPGFPLILAPVVNAFQLNFFAYKLYILFFFVLFLALSAYYFRGKINDVAVVGIVFIIGSSIFFWQLMDSVLSDIPGAAFFILALILFEKSIKSGKIRFFILTGIVIAFSFLIRSTAIVLIPAMWAHILFGKGRQFKAGIIITLTTICFIVIVNAVLPSESNYVAMMQQTIGHKNIGELLSFVWHNIEIYINSFRDLSIGGGYHNILTNDIIFFGGAILFVVGWGYSIFKKHSLLEWLFLMYFGMIVIWPGFQGLRYFTPIIPIYLYYIVIALESLLSQKQVYIAGSFYLLLALFSSISAFTNMNNMTPVYGVDGPNSKALFDAIRSNTEPDALIMANKPRAIGLMTGRNGIVFPDYDHRGKLRDCVQEYQVQYLVLPTGGYDPPYANVDIVPDTVRYKPLYANPEWTLLKVTTYAP